MASVASVIVDVPTMQTNTPYSYEIPNELSDQVQPGMRVVVPFGTRKVQGMVVGLADTSQFDGDLRPIEGLMDIAPVLNPELLALAEWMADTTFSFAISCIMTILPSVMRAKYEKWLVQQAALPAEIDRAVFQGADTVLFDESAYSANLMAELVRLRKGGQLTLEYRVKNQAKKKTLTGLELAISTSQLEEDRNALTKRAETQQVLADYFLADPTAQPLMKDVAEALSISASTINTVVKKGWLNKIQIEQYRDPFKQPIVPSHKLTLNDDQQAAVTAITTAIEKKQQQTFLLEGVTGSGKTEVYLQSIDYALAQGKTALVLVPEISLTPQTVNRFKSRFGNQVAVLHSGLSAGEKYDEWRRIEAGDAKVVVGVRSAAFAPLENLGLIVMDEEHESSYKQDEAPRYHARDVSLWRAAYHQCPVVLGSATPSLESRARATRGLYTKLDLPIRINQQAMPPVEIVDMREQMAEIGESNFSLPLKDAINQRLARHEQTVLMLNRRGFSSFVMCRDCGFVLKCPNCDISLTLHMDSHSMKCHYCGHEEAIPNQCPNCHSRKIRYYGTGTEKVEAEMKTLFPDANVIRMDVDTTRKKGAHEKLLKQFGDGKADILLGTQMIAKGLDFPNVTLVGVLNADTSLELPDFRSSERTFQLLTQVSGRAGRDKKPGEVIIQTFNPDHYAIQLAKHQDYERFFATEMAIRHEGNYPPYFFTAKITASHEDEAAAAKAMFQISKELHDRLSDQIIILGPTPKAISRVKNKYYYQIVLKYKSEPALHDTLMDLMQNSQKLVRSGLQISIDNEPLSFM